MIFYETIPRPWKIVIRWIFLKLRILIICVKRVNQSKACDSNQFACTVYCSCLFVLFYWSDNRWEIYHRWCVGDLEFNRLGRFLTLKSCQGQFQIGAGSKSRCQDFLDWKKIPASDNDVIRQSIIWSKGTCPDLFRDRLYQAKNRFQIRFKINFGLSLFIQSAKSLLDLIKHLFHCIISFSTISLSRN